MLASGQPSVRSARVIAQEGGNGSVGVDRGTRVALFPVRHCPAADAETATSLSLSEPKFQPPPADVLPEGSRFKVESLSFQTFERDWEEWQEGNASLSVWLAWALERAVLVHTRSHYTLPREALGTAAGSHRHAR